MRTLSIIAVVLCLLNLSSISTSAQEIAIAADKENLFYLGIPNPITIACYKYPCKDLIVTSDNGTVDRSHDHPCQFEMMAAHVGETTIEVKQKNGKVIGVRKFRVHKIPGPVAEVGGKNFGDINAPALRVQIGVIATLKGFDFDARFWVMSYTIILLKKEASFVKDNAGAKFTDESKVILSKAQAGDRFVIVNIRAKGPDGVLRFLTPIELNVTE